jgi:hypothetical protein
MLPSCLYSGACSSKGGQVSAVKSVIIVMYHFCNYTRAEFHEFLLFLRKILEQIQNYTTNIDGDVPLTRATASASSAFLST